MKYPDFLKKGDTIGICAPSAGVGYGIEEYIESIEVLKKEGFSIVETKSVRKNSLRSASARVRAKEIDVLSKDENVKMIMCATGGEYMYEILPYIDFKQLSDNPKWVMGYSDPTVVLYPLTTKYDTATLYGFDSKGYSSKLRRDQKENIRIITGDLVKQKSFRKYQGPEDYLNNNLVFDKDVRWLSKNDLSVEGRLIGGCLEIISFLIGTEYDGTSEFIEKYKDDGIVWFFDIYNMTADNVYLQLLQFKNAGYFKYTKAVLVSRVAIPSEDSYTGMTYKKAFELALKDIPCVMEMDIGHSYPHMTLINGSIIRVNVKDGKGDISFKLK